MGGAYHSWSPVFPDEGGLLINTCDLTLGYREHVPDGFIASDQWSDHHNTLANISKETRIILHTCKLQSIAMRVYT